MNKIKFKKQNGNMSNKSLSWAPRLICTDRSKTRWGSENKLEQQWANTASFLSHFYCSTYSQPPPSLVVVITHCGGRVCMCVCMCESKPGWETCLALSNISWPICCGPQKLLYCTYHTTGEGGRLGIDALTVGTHWCMKGALNLLSALFFFPLWFISHFFFNSVFLLLCVCACVCFDYWPVIKSHGT